MGPTQPDLKPHLEHSHTPGHRHDVADHAHADGQAEILDLDAEVLAEHTASIVTWLPLERSPRRIVDLGCGTGAGTFALLARFPEAQVTAVDVSVDNLHRLREKACEAGVTDQVHTVQADLDSSWPDLGEPDLVWVSAALHHMADPDRILRRVRDTLAPDGLLVVVELADFPRFLPDDAPENRPGLEQRCHAAINHSNAERLPHRGADWGPRLAAAGFTAAGERTVTVDIERSRSEAVGRYALSGLRRMRGALASALNSAVNSALNSALSPDDLAALDELLDTDSPRGLLHRDDLVLRTERAVWAARPDGAASQNIAPHSVPAEHEAWQQGRWEEIAGANGKAKVVARGLVTDRETHLIPGVPGRWSTTGAGALTVAAVAADGVRVGGEVVDGTAEVAPGAALEFPGGRVGFAGGADGSYGLVVTDPQAVARSGLSGIDAYRYDPAWVFEGSYRAAPEGRRIEVGRLTAPPSTEAILAPVDLVVTIDNTEYVLAVLEDMPGQRLVIFTDETNGTGTPEIGRWLVLPLLEPGSTLPVDFNRATLSHHHLAPTVFTCPLSPPGNHLPMRVEAGERSLVHTGEKILKDRSATFLRHLENRDWAGARAMCADTATVWHNDGKGEEPIEQTMANMRNQISGIESMRYDVTRQLSERDEVLQQHVINVVTKNGAHVQVHAAAYFRFENGLITRIEEYASAPSEGDA
jgi:uncharacterized protein (DUF1684 family)/SAM-dependent methyltransferase/ketosteroid isomerase-like protein